MKRRSPLLAVIAIMGHVLVPLEGQAQQVPDWLAKLKLPNSGAKSIMTPSAWGAAYGSAFVGAGAVERQPYLPTADGVVGLGYGMGDPVLRVGLQLGTTVSDLSEFDNLSFSFKLHRYLARGTSIAIGGESLLAYDQFVDDAGDTFYFAVSHVVQALGSSRPGVGRVHVSAGVGTGRFAKKSDRDFSEGKGRNGTAGFGSIAVEVASGMNAIVEWTGTNLLTGVNRTMREIVGSEGAGNPVGRRLEFLLQEFGREANTIGAKGSDAPISHEVVSLKTELERIREQVQNVE